MFHEASNKLSAVYLSIIMAISLFFSANIYQVSVAEFNRDYARQQNLISRSQLLPPSQDALDRFLDERQHQYAEAKQRLLVRLVIINGFIFVSGGFISYYFARRTLKPIEEAHEALEQFTADASHELRTPITVMQTEIEVALSDPGLTVTEAREQLESNLEELAKLTHLSEGLLRLAQLDTTLASQATTTIKPVIASVVKQLLPLAEKKGITILRRDITDGTVTADKSSLSEALMIIVENAIKYSPEKSEITVSSHKDGGSLAITVKDNGQGIKKEDLGHIFERFYRSDKARTKQTTHGYGLGLAIAKNIIELHKGSISVDSEIHKGSTFTIRLPSVKQQV